MLYILSTSILYLVILLVSKHVVTLSHARKEGRRDPRARNNILSQHLPRHYRIFTSRMCIYVYFML